jgi:2-hydroxychromene-2-carboxylate isomerase
MLWPAMSPTLDFYFFIGSTYSHLSVWRAAALAHERGVELVWRPFSVRTLMREQQNPPFVGKPVKMRYMWRDVERRARRFGVPFAGEPPYPIDRDERANHLAMRAALDGWCPEFARAAYHEWFIERRDPGDEATLRAIIASTGHDPDAELTPARMAECIAAYQRQTDRARELGLFGSPTFVCGQEIFWGDDRLEDALDWAVSAAH